MDGFSREYEEENFWEFVKSASYYLEVLKKMGTFASGTLTRFGTTGKGEHPNYQQHYGDGRVATYIGMTHRSASDVADVFDETKISRPYTYQDVLEMKLRAEKRGHR